MLQSLDKPKRMYQVGDSEWNGIVTSNSLTGAQEKGMS